MKLYLKADSHIKNKIKVELDFFNYATKSCIKKQQMLINQNLQKDDLASLKSVVVKLDIDEL